MQVRSYRSYVTDLETHAPGRRDRKKLQTRAALIEAALRLVDERGLAAVTVEEISAAADVSTRTFFNYFASKDEAIIGDPLVESRGIGERLATVAPEIPMIGALLLALGPSIAQIQADQDIWKVRVRVIDNNPALLPALMARATHSEREFIEAIADRAGLGPESAYPQVASAVVGGAFRAAMLRWAAGHDPRPLSDLVHEAFGIVATGLTDPPSQTDSPAGSASKTGGPPGPPSKTGSPPRPPSKTSSVDGSTDKTGSPAGPRSKTGSPAGSTGKTSSLVESTS
jgi:AcrR family transcriptional regulator